MKVFLILIFSINYALAGEVKSVDDQIANDMFHHVKLEYIKGAKTLVKKYNQKRNINKSQFTKSLQKYGYATKNKNIPSELPKMIIKKSGLEIPQIGFRYDFKSYLYGVIKLNGKLLQLNCKEKVDCLRQIQKHRKTKEVSFFEFIIKSAHASKEDMALLLKEDNLILGAMLLIDKEMEVLPTLGSLLTSEEEIKRRIVQNLKRLNANIKKNRDECHEWQEDVENYGESHNTRIGEHSFTSMANTLKKMVEYDDFSDLEGDLNDYIGGDVFHSTTFKTVLLSDNGDWKNYLQCKYLDGTIKTIENDKFEGVRAQVREDRNIRIFYKADQINVTEDTKEYCKNFAQLKSCLQDFHNKVADKVNSGREDDEDDADYFKDYEETVSDRAASRRE